MATVVILILAGAALLLLETLLPGLIAGILGFGCLVAGVAMGYTNFGPQTGNYILLGVVFGLVVGAVCYVRYFPNSRAAQCFISQGTSGELGVERPDLIEQTGTAITHLRPAGAALIHGKRVDVVTEGAMIEKGAEVKVVAVEGLRVVVRQI